jgi:alpha-beta hydrolase superfamily lysophospholipase
MPSFAVGSDTQTSAILTKPSVDAGVAHNVTNGPVLREDVNQLSQELSVPIIKWSRPDSVPIAVLIALHGSTLHGGTFDQLAREMVARGYMVVAPDIRGFGRWLSEKDTYTDGEEIRFYKDRADLVMLLQRLRREHPSTPLYCIGESMGSNMSLWVASVHPDLVDGVILSSPCIQRHWCINKTMMKDFFKAVRAPHHQVPTAPYARRYLSESKDVTEGYLADPGIRKTMSAYESFQSFHVNRTCLLYVENIPQHMPILVIEGTQDKMYVADAVKPLMKRISSNDKTVHFLPNRGHIHLETAHIKPDVVKTVDEWLRTRIQTASARKRNAPSISAKPNEL